METLGGNADACFKSIFMPQLPTSIGIQIEFIRKMLLRLLEALDVYQDSKLFLFHLVDFGRIKY